ncbi:diacylglycerol kinase family protein [bacterium]|nr:diacylglycerol kinase family protein [bacterium]
MEDKKRHYKLLKKFGYALNGIRLAITKNTSFAIHLIISFLICFLSIYFNINTLELMFILSAIFSVLITELINTAIEESINGYTKEFKRVFMISKDSAAGAVLLASFYSVIIGIIVFGPKFYVLFFE